MSLVFFGIFSTLTLTVLMLEAVLNKKLLVEKRYVKKLKAIIMSNFGIIGVLMLFGLTLALPDKTMAVTVGGSGLSKMATSLINPGTGYIGAGLSTGLASLGAGVGTGIVGAKSINILKLNPKMLGKSMIFAGLANGVATYGLIISILIMSKV